MARPDPRTTMNISIPRSLKTWIDAQVRDGGYGTASEFIRHIVRAARTGHDRLEASLVAALAQGSSPMTDSDWDRIRTEGERRAAIIRRRRAAAQPARRKPA